LRADSPDTALDQWVESRIYPALTDIPELADFIETLSPQGYDYQRDDEMATWGSQICSIQLPTLCEDHYDYTQSAGPRQGRWYDVVDLHGIRYAQPAG
jgi:hypothetical protein